MKYYSLSLFVFRRDLRLEDNSGLIQALNESEAVIPLFIIDPQQVDDVNKWKSNNAIQFMRESLIDLHEQLVKKKFSLVVMHGKPATVINELIQKNNIEAVYVNQDYTPFSIKRDEEIKKICIKNKCSFIDCHDLLLHNSASVLSQSGAPYAIFTAFYKQSIKIPVTQPVSTDNSNFYCGTVVSALSITSWKNMLTHDNKDIHVHGGSYEGNKILRRIIRFALYQKTRDFPAIATTNLSAHLKFGTLSIRAAYHTILDKLGSSHPLIRQLYWRDFFTYIAYHNSFVFGQPYRKKYANIPWRYDNSKFKAWTDGKTGFPIVDAGMRQLNKTGYMHNRVRMIAASFLIKDLHIDWRWGEQYFAQKLIDYDPAVNNGNWQWCASTGCDAQPYFRIFNPWLQQKKYDADCVYIKRWIPELSKTPTNIIHSWFNKHDSKLYDYPAPIVNHTQEAKITKALYQAL